MKDKGRKRMARQKSERELLAAEIIKKYQPKSIEDMQDALKDIFGPLFQAMLAGELEHHFEYFALRIPPVRNRIPPVHGNDTTC